ncbi:hypothetical protein PMAC_001756 [Pneumocystis sp. 'macacae']|nr:hypothetical protein PMAC_001756 [Pneumocystis sp. 'macacae']
MDKETLSFSNNEKEVVQRSLKSNRSCKDSNISFNEVYEIADTRDFILKGRFQRVALQFPDELIGDASEVSICLGKDLSATFFILGDTSYGSCCVDEITAQHVNADCLIHYGHSCLSPIGRLPVKYVFGRKNLDLERCLEAFETVYERENQVILTGEQCYANALDEMFFELVSRGYDRVVRNGKEYSKEYMTKAINEDILRDEDSEEQPSSIYEDFSVFYVGKESPALTTFAMTCHLHVASFYSYDPLKHKVIHQSPGTDARLRCRYMVVQKAKDASVIGIVVGTLGVSRYLEMIQHMRKIIKKAGRKSYTFVIGKLNPEKLANFSEIELFVLVSCPENSLIESKDFYRPIATPYELYLALSSNIWNKKWITDFSSILSLRLKETELSEKNEPHFSLVTGRLVQPSITKEEHVQVRNEPPLYNGQDLIKSSEHRHLSVMHRVHSISANFHKNERNWHGLSEIKAQTQAASLEIGKSGIASQYQNEHKH